MVFTWYNMASHNHILTIYSSYTHLYTASQSHQYIIRYTLNTIRSHMAWQSYHCVIRYTFNTRYSHTARHHNYISHILLTCNKHINTYCTRVACTYMHTHGIWPTLTGHTIRHWNTHTHTSHEIRDTHTDITLTCFAHPHGYCITQITNIHKGLHITCAYYSHHKTQSHTTMMNKKGNTDYYPQWYELILSLQLMNTDV